MRESIQTRLDDPPMLKCWCGGTPFVEETSHEWESGKKFIVRCSRCDDHLFHYADTREEAIRKWNEEHRQGE